MRMFSGCLDRKDTAAHDDGDWLKTKVHAQRASHCCERHCATGLAHVLLAVLFEHEQRADLAVAQHRDFARFLGMACDGARCIQCERDGERAAGCVCDRVAARQADRARDDRPKDHMGAERRLLVCWRPIDDSDLYCPGPTVSCILSSPCERQRRAFENLARGHDSFTDDVCLPRPARGGVCAYGWADG